MSVSKKPSITPTDYRIEKPTTSPTQTAIENPTKTPKLNPTEVPSHDPPTSPTQLPTKNHLQLLQIVFLQIIYFLSPQNQVALQQIIGSKNLQLLQLKLQ